ncbi:hypothetical protein, partial [Mesorhizobium sp. M7A.F.Ca.CA.001.12.2.1]|uniref:hypothetical protein n=1 Tax=Mesorhizobium sp. M7A.F.Ca.CA.001.12.2.1 TaxID=2496725 RepID=UPI0019D141DF
AIASAAVLGVHWHFRPSNRLGKYSSMEDSLTELAARLQMQWRAWAPAIGLGVAAAIGMIWTVYLPIVGLRHMLGYN